MFKAHGRAPTSNLNFWFLMFSVFMSLELLLTIVFILHIVNPMANVFGFGFPFLFVMPGLTLMAPIWGLSAILCGSATMLKSYSNMNSTMLVLNYPLTLMILIFAQEPAVYSAIIILLMLNKVTISFFGSKVRQHFVNPTFAKNQLKMKETLADMLAMAPQVKVLTPAERAS